MERFPNSVNPLIGKYLNRLGDLLFVLARITNKKMISTGYPISTKMNQVIIKS